MEGCVKNLNLKLSWKWILIILLIIILIIGSVFYLKWINRVVPEELINETLEKSLGANSYRYGVFLKLIVNGDSRILSDIKGEKNEDSFHLSGEMLAQEVEIYQLKDDLFMKDSLSGRWMERPGVNILKNELFLMEVNPLSCFRFVEVLNISYLGIEDKNNISSYVLKCQPKVENKMMNKFWKDFVYKLWVNKKTHRISGAEINAVHKNDSNVKMIMNIELKDYNKTIKIDKPKEK